MTRETVARQRLVISEQDIARRLEELGRRITADYAGRSLTVIGVLNGAFIFVADLVRRIELPLEIDFVRLASYGSATSSSGQVRCTKDVELCVRGRDLLLVEDIVDTGRTLATIREMLACRGPGSIRVCALIDKQERREVEVTVDYAGFTVPEGFLVGYGLDLAERYRNLPAIYHLENID